MAKAKSIPIPAEIAETACNRFVGIEGVLRTAAATLDGGDDVAKAMTPDALRFAADQLSELYCALDVSSWADGMEVASATAEEVQS